MIIEYTYRMRRYARRAALCSALVYAQQDAMRHTFRDVITAATFIFYAGFRDASFYADTLAAMPGYAIFSMLLCLFATMLCSLLRAAIRLFR